MSDLFQPDEFDYGMTNYLATKHVVHPRMCFQNSLKVQMKNPSLELVYIEGYAVLRGRSGYFIQHGWLEYRNRIVDVTLPKKVVKYFPVVKLSLKQVVDLGLTSKDLPFLIIGQHLDKCLDEKMVSVVQDAKGFIDNLVVMRDQIESHGYSKPIQLKLPLVF